MATRLPTIAIVTYSRDRMFTSEKCEAPKTFRTPTSLVRCETKNETMIKLAVIAHIRHTETNYDELLSKGLERFEAREAVEDKIFEVFYSWQR